MKLLDEVKLKYEGGGHNCWRVEEGVKTVRKTSQLSSMNTSVKHQVDIQSRHLQSCAVGVFLAGAWQVTGSAKGSVQCLLCSSCWSHWGPDRGRSQTWLWRVGRVRRGLFSHTGQRTQSPGQRGGRRHGWIHESSECVLRLTAPQKCQCEQQTTSKKTFSETEWTFLNGWC